MNELTRRQSQEKNAAEQLTEIKADRWDSMFFPSQPAFGVVERAFRRGFVHALVSIADFAEDVPPEFRAWIKANLEIYNKWRDDFRDSTKPTPIRSHHRRRCFRTANIGCVRSANLNKS